MTKVQLRNEVLNTLVAHKANKNLAEAITELMNSYTATKVKEQRPKVIEVEDTKYIWCNRHEIYEPAGNFKNEKSAECKVASKRWSDLTKEVHKIEAQLQEALDNEDYELAGETNKTLKAAKEARGGKFSYENDMLEYPEIEGYDYEAEHFIKEDELTK